VYARGEQFESSGDKTTFVKVSVESGVRVKELLPTFYGLYITCGMNILKTNSKTKTMCIEFQENTT
jgi:hypothetical protein